MTSLRSGGKAYHDQNAIMKPNHEKKNTLPYMLIGLSAGMDSAFKLTGFNFGARHKVVISKPIFTRRGWKLAEEEQIVEGIFKELTPISKLSKDLSQTQTSLLQYGQKCLSGSVRSTVLK